MNRLFSFAKSWLAALAGLALTVLAGCNDPCATLADRTCARTGQADALCKKLRTVALAPKAADLQACEAGNAFADELEKR